MNEFPKNFLWGAATSSHQVEGGNRHNDWWDWETRRKVNTPSLKACEHYERYEHDFDLAKSLYHNAHRLSLEWSRLEPSPNHWDKKEFEHYHKVIDALIQRGIEPIVTLHHFTNPLWLSKIDGWANPHIAEYFERFARKAAEAFGKKVRYWVTLNEPMVYLYHSYFSREWPPGEQSPRKALKVFRHQLLAHIAAYKAIHECAKVNGSSKPMVGAANHMVSFSPCRPASWEDRLAMLVRHFFSNHLFVKSLQSGFLFFPGLFCEALPARRTMDFLGLNYYTRDFIHFAGFQFPGIFGDICSQEHHRDAGERNVMGWEIYPKGIFDLLMILKGYQLPVMILENGICTENDGQRKEFIRRHLIEVKHAIAKGVEVIGYMYWSLLDNFEWAHGFRPRFGLIDVNYDTQIRTVRESARFYAEICRSNCIPV